MRFRYYYDPEIGSTHIAKHGVSTDEIAEFFTEIGYFPYRRDDGSYEAYGKLHSGRCIEVAYRLLAKDILFIITAFDIENPIIREYVESQQE